MTHVVSTMVMSLDGPITGPGRDLPRRRTQRTRLERIRVLEGDPSTHPWLRVVHD
ncbi:MAG: hypothetical protein ABW122_02425 [Ilumatobacteraceae bacterium]